MSENGVIMTIQELRQMTNMSQRKFSAYFGIPTSTLQDWEHGRRTPPPYIINMMSRILKLEKILLEKTEMEEESYVEKTSDGL